MNLESVMAIQRIVGEIALCEGMRAIPQLQIRSVEFTVPKMSNGDRLRDAITKRLANIHNFEVKKVRKGRMERIRINYTT